MENTINNTQIVEEVLSEVVEQLQANLIPTVVVSLNQEFIKQALGERGIDAHIETKVAEVKRNADDLAEKAKEASKDVDIMNIQIREIKNELEAIKHKTPLVVITPSGGKKEIDGLKHGAFEELLHLVTMNIPAYLVGPAGTGKNHAVEQIAKLLELPFYFTNAVTQEYKLTGYGNAEGDFVETPLYLAMKHGGLFFFDEIDASVPEALIVVNACLANGYFDFPVVGRVEAHPNFRVVSAGNTNGTGASNGFTARSRMDSATLDRFLLINWYHDKALEDAIVDGIIEGYLSTLDPINVEGELDRVRGILIQLKELRATLEKLNVSSPLTIRNMTNAMKLVCYMGYSYDKAIKPILVKYSENDLGKIKAGM